MNKDRVLGLFIIVLAGLFLSFELGAFGDLKFPLSIVQIILLIIAVYILIEGLSRGSIMQVCLSVGYITYVITTQLFNVEMSFGASALIYFAFAIGLQKIFGSPKFKKRQRDSIHFEFNDNDRDYNEQTSTASSSQSEHHISVIFAEDTRYINSNNLQTVDAKVKCGEVRIFLNQSQIVGNSATVNINVDFGNCTIFVPKTWRVDDHLRLLFSGSTIEGYPQSDADKVLNVQGVVNFGSVTIIYI